MSPGAVLTLLGGYLGAGKTTVVNELLRRTDRRVAVLVNDFGEVGVDASLIRRRTQDTIELANGCICCTLSDAVATALAEVARRRPPFEHVVVELSGVGLPGQMVRWGRFPGLRPGPVVVCVDAQRVRKKVADRWIGDTVRAQLTQAEVVLLTKADLVTAKDAEATRAWLTKAYPQANVVIADHGIVPLDLLLSGTPEPGGLERPGSQDEGHRHGSDFSSTHVGHISWSATGSGIVERADLVRYLEQLPEAVVRTKGILRLADSPDRRTVVQLVDHHWELCDDGPWSPGDVNRMVVISRPRVELGAHPASPSDAVPEATAALTALLAGSTAHNSADPA